MELAFYTCALVATVATLRVVTNSNPVHALLYLVVEELLVEAHEEKESVALGASYFAGFLVIYVLSALGG